MNEYVVFYDVLIDGEFRTVYAHCPDWSNLMRELKRCENHGYQNVEVFQSIPIPPTKDEEVKP